MSKFYVGNLAFSTTEHQLRELFAQHGTVDQVQVVTDPQTGESRGFAFVTMAEGTDGTVTGLNGTDFGGRALKVDRARPRPAGNGNRP